MSINLGSSFGMQAALPLDDRMQVADLTARNAIPAGKRWEGMTVYCVYDTKTYQLKGGIVNSNWIEAGGGGQFPGSSLDNEIARYDSTTGKIIKSGSGVTIADGGGFQGVSSIGGRTGDNLYISNPDPAKGIVFTRTGYNTSGNFFSPTGPNAVLTTPDSDFMRLTGTPPTNIIGITAPAFNQKFTLANISSGPVTIKNASGTGDATILTGMGDYILPVGGSVDFTWNFGNGWFMKAGMTVASAGGTGAVGASDVDVIFQETFDSAVIGDFTQTGFSIDSTAPLRGTKSGKFTHHATLTYSAKQVKAIPLSMRGQNATFRLRAFSSATVGNVTVLFRDETNNVDLDFSQQIAATTTTQVFQFGVNIPASCASFSYTVTALPQAGSPVTYIDDIQLSTFWMGTAIEGQTQYSFDTPAMTEWASFTPVITGSTSGTYSAGTGTKVAKWRRVGDTMELNYTVQSGTGITDIVGAYVFAMPSGYSIDFNKLGGLGNVTVGVGAVSQPANGGCVANLVAYTYGGGNAFLLTQDENNTTTPGVISNSNTYISSVNYITSFRAAVPIVGWTSTQTKTFTSTDIVPAKAMMGNASFDIPYVTSWVDAGATVITAATTNPTKGTVATDKMRWRRVGENMELSISYRHTNNGSAGSGQYFFGLPAGYQIDTSKLSGVGTVANNLGLFSGSVSDGVTLTDHYTGWFYAIDSTKMAAYFQYSRDSSAAANGAGAASSTFGSLGNKETTYTGVLLIPILGWSKSETKTFAVAQQGLIQEQDFLLHMASSTTQSTAGAYPFTTVTKTMGDGMTYDSVNKKFVASKAGLYTVTCFFGSPINTNTVAILNQGSAGLTAQNVPSTASGGYGELSATYYLAVGEDFNLSLSSGTINTAGIQITRQGTLKQVNVNANQKATIPTHEMRFNMSGATLGTGVVAGTNKYKATSLDSMKGDGLAFINDGTGLQVTVKKKGTLSVSMAAAATTGTWWVIMLNGKSIAADASGGVSGGCSATLDVVANDIVEIVGSAALATNTTNVVTFNLRENDIAVSVSNTLPQFSESDSVVKVVNGNGFGSSSTRARRFGSTIENRGTDITYTDSATLGAQFTVNSSGLYNVAYADGLINSVGASFLQVVRGAYTGADVLSASGNLLASLTLRYSPSSDHDTASAQVWLNAGDVVQCLQNTPAALVSNSTVAQFTISKVGKPQVTGVNINPFLSIPMPTTQAMAAVSNAVSMGQGVLALTPSNTDGSGIFSYSAGVITFLKRALFNAAMTIRSSTTGGPEVAMTFRGNDVSSDKAALAISSWASCSYSDIANPGDTLTFKQWNSSSDYQRISISATSAENAAIEENKVVRVRAEGNAGQVVATTGNISFAKIEDTHNAWDGQIFTAPETAEFDIDCGVIFNTNGVSRLLMVALDTGSGMSAYRGMGTRTGTEDIVKGRLKMYLVKGWKIAIREVNVAGTLSNNTTWHYLTIEKSVSASMNVAPLSRVAVRAVQSSGQSIPQNVITPLVWDSARTFDTHGAFNPTTGIFTSPESAYYQYSGQISYASASNGINTQLSLLAYKQGVSIGDIADGFPTSTSASPVTLTGSDLIYLAKGETLSLSAYHNQTAARPLIASAGLNRFSIIKVS